MRPTLHYFAVQSCFRFPFAVWIDPCSRLQSCVIARQASWPGGRRAGSLVMRVLDIPRSGKRGDTVWQRNRYGQYSYPAFIPFNPRTPAQVAFRETFGAVSKRWRALTEDQRIIWCAVAKTKKSKPRLCQCGPLTGFLLFVKVNVAFANRGIAQVDLPPGYAACSRPVDPKVVDTTRFDQPPVGPLLFHRSTRLVAAWQDCPEELMAGQPP